MKRFLFIPLFLYAFALAQMSFLVHFFPAGLIPNLIVFAVLFFAVFEKPESYTSFGAALFGGLLIDIFSGGIIGLWPALLLGATFLIKIVLENYVRISIPQKL